MTHISNKKFALDTNILVYLLNNASSFYDQARLAVLKTEKQKIQLVVCQQNLVELVRVLTDYYQYNLIQAVNQVNKLMETNIQVVTPLTSTINTYLELCRKADGKARRHFDLYLAATLIDNKIETLITNDKSGFKGIKKLKVIDLLDIGEKNDLRNLSKIHSALKRTRKLST